MHPLLLPYNRNPSKLISTAECEEALRRKVPDPKHPACTRLLDRCARIVVQLGIASEAEVEKHPYTAIWLGEAAFGRVFLVVADDRLFRLSDAAFIWRWSGRGSRRSEVVPLVRTDFPLG